MSNFALSKIKAVKGQQAFYKLLKNNRCPFDEFESSLEARYQSELAASYAYMERVANGGSMPQTKFKDITQNEKQLKSMR